MPTLRVEREIDLEVTDCCNCGTYFAMPRRLYNARRQDGRTFYCPNGHPMVFSQSEVDRLKGELAKAARNLELSETRRRQANERADAIERSRSAIKGQVTKIKNRIANGVCPCCNRSFANLHRHMCTKHPDYTGEPVE